MASHPLQQSIEYRQFLEETVLTVFLWVGIWGAISHIIDHYFKRYFYSEILIYITIALVSFSLLSVRGYVAKTDVKA
jgi:glycerol uptake facilitator-like aquaporin